MTAKNLVLLLVAASQHRCPNKDAAVLNEIAEGVENSTTVAEQSVARNQPGPILVCGDSRRTSVA